MNVTHSETKTAHARGTVDREVVSLDGVVAASERLEESPRRKLVISVGQA